VRSHAASPISAWPLCRRHSTERMLFHKTLSVRDNDFAEASALPKRKYEPSQETSSPENHKRSIIPGCL